METLAGGSAAPANADNTAQADTHEADAERVDANGDGSAPSVHEADTSGTSNAPKRDKFQERIDTLTREKYDGLSRAERAEYRAQLAEQRLADAEARQAKTEQVAPANDFPTLESHGYDEGKYQAAVAKYFADIAEKRADARVDARLSEAEAKRAAQKTGESWAKKEAEFIKSKPDYVDKVQNASRLPISEAMQDALMESDFGPQIALHLVENREQALAIAAMPVAQQMRELGRIEARMEAEKARPKPAVSQAPPPVQKVDSADAQVEKEPSAMTDNEFAKWRKKQIAARRNQ
jgi:hypothetical protein